MKQQTDFPEFPPGFWRRIELVPGPGWIAGGVEDDFHRFSVLLHHRQGRITRAEARAHRHPWSGCGGAPQHLVSDIEGCDLADIAARDPLQHCTHLFDLAIVCAAHAQDSAPTRFDMQVSDKVDDRFTATLHRNGQEVIRWQVEGTTIAGPEPFAGRDLKKLSSWKAEFPTDTAEFATMLRRASYVAGGRMYRPKPGIAAHQSPLAKLAPCYNYQPRQLEHSMPRSDRRDLVGEGIVPLDGFDPRSEYAELA